MENPMTEDTTVPTTDTPVSELPTAVQTEGEAGNVNALVVVGMPASGSTSAEIVKSDLGESSNAANSAATVVDASALPATIAPHLEAIYRAAVDHAGSATKPSLFSEIKEHASGMLHSIRNGMSVAEGDFVAKLEKLVSLL
ncbi:hypothetical protein [Paraburkholderia fynbosensis]|uniref:Uncharacterized protein n=1 Tax=Paraburkholderia fynbosensis TaxID=1200993 RepID=A0A6J5FKB6_9BURK|nr:hypothetical protein [Paraburkholderia fynbosensis]CAB3782113.1 hypothetical protein LMG27177_01169 [Paraburkholderia fynbosensis]